MIDASTARFRALANLDEKTEKEKRELELRMKQFESNNKKLVKDTLSILDKHIKTAVENSKFSIDIYFIPSLIYKAKWDKDHLELHDRFMFDYIVYKLKKLGYEVEKIKTIKHINVDKILYNVNWLENFDEDNED